MKHYLFICSQNRLRSPTAEFVFRDFEGIETRSAGTDRDAQNALSLDDIEWADTIFAMEKRHKNILQKRFRDGISNKRVVVLEIPDEFDYMDAELISILKIKMRPYF
jgi:predicted protein tyrosine phosphatase